MAYVVGKVIIFSKKDGSHAQQEVSCVSVDEFDVAFATLEAELDMCTHGNEIYSFWVSRAWEVACFWRGYWWSVLKVLLQRHTPI